MSDTHIRVLDSDYERLGGLAERFTQKIGEYRFLAMVEGHCAALSIEIDGRFVCTIYERRPGLCRTYDCRGDTRIWLDFERRIPNPSLAGLAGRSDRGQSRSREPVAPAPTSSPKKSSPYDPK